MNVVTALGVGHADDVTAQPAQQVDALVTVAQPVISLAVIGPSKTASQPPKSIWWAVMFNSRFGSSHVTIV